MNRKGSSIFWGGIFVLAATFIIVSQLGYLGHINVITILLSIGLGAIIFRSIPTLNFAGLLIPTAFLCILYDEQWGITELTPWPVLITAVLGSIGLSLIFDRRKHYTWNHHYDHHNNDKDFRKKDGDAIDLPDGNKIEFSCRFGGCSKYVNTDNFQRADLQCDFGGMKIYFDNVIIQGDYAEVYINTSFGGIEMYIPKNWRIENYTQNFFGGLDEHKHPKTDEYDKVLKIYGNISFAGVEIIYI